jgi:hypothetical protein
MKQLVKPMITGDRCEAYDVGDGAHLRDSSQTWVLPGTNHTLP